MYLPSQPWRAGSKVRIWFSGNYLGRFISYALSTFDNFQHNYGLFCVIQLFLYLSLGQRGQENESLQIFRVKHTASWHSIFGIIHHDFSWKPKTMQQEWPPGHQGPGYSANTRSLCSLQSQPAQVWYPFPEKSSCNLASAVGLNQEWIRSVAAGLLSA